MHDEITWEPALTRDVHGQVATYGPAVQLECRVTYRNRMTRDTTGTEKISTTTIYVAGAPGIDVADRITLPDGSQPPIITRKKFPHEDEMAHEEILT
jgi:hypothetical protein